MFSVFSVDASSLSEVRKTFFLAQERVFLLARLDFLAQNEVAHWLTSVFWRGLYNPRTSTLVFKRELMHLIDALD